MSNRRVNELKKKIKETKRYEFRDGSVYPEDLTAQKAGEELNRIYERDGVLKAETVVAEAKPEEAPLHPAFEWEDQVAAEKYRNYQAKNLIRAVKVVDPTTGIRVPEFIHVRATTPAQVEGVENECKDSGYYLVEAVVKSDDMFTTALRELTEKFHAAKEAVEMFKAVAAGQPGSRGEILSILGIASQAMSTAETAIKSLHRAA